MMLNMVFLSALCKMRGYLRLTLALVNTVVDLTGVLQYKNKS